MKNIFKLKEETVSIKFKKKMKIKPQINLPKNYLSKKSSNLIITNDIEIDSENENSIIIVNNKKSDEITKPKSKSKDNKNKKKKNKKI